MPLMNVDISPWGWGLTMWLVNFNSHPCLVWWSTLNIVIYISLDICYWFSHLIGIFTVTWLLWLFYVYIVINWLTTYSSRSFFMGVCGILERSLFLKALWFSSTLEWNIVIMQKSITICWEIFKENCINWKAKVNMLGIVWRMVSTTPHLPLKKVEGTCKYLEERYEVMN